MNFFEERTNKIIINKILATLPKIKVKSGSCRYNFRCQMNAVHDALNNDEEQIAMCFYITEGYPIIHFININKNGEYIDNTLGRWSERNEYFLIKKIDKEDFFDVNTIFTAYRKEIRKSLPLYLRILNGEDF